MERTQPATETGPTAAAPGSFDRFFETEAPVLFRRLCLVTGSRPEAEDVMQDAFIKLYERWDRVAGLEDPQGYLYRTAFNVFRRRARRAALAVKRQLHLAAPADEFEIAEDRQVVAQELARLTPRQRAALVLTELAGYSSEEAGGLLGVRAVTVRALASQGRAAMRERLGGRDE
jgi:RNA polymerase sigma-70 factor, ECF subfamily